MTNPVVFIGPLPFEQRLSFAISNLLTPVGADRASPVVPHDSRRIEAQGPATLLEPPTHVDIVTGGPKLGVESANLLQAALAEGHIAARDMLRLSVREQNV